MNATDNQSLSTRATSKKPFPIRLINTLGYNLINGFRQVLAFMIFGPRTVSFFARIKIAWRILFARNRNKHGRGTSLGEQLVLVGAILKIPPEKPGAIAEFGCYKGLTSAVISIAARYTGRRVIVFDSFEGLPEPMETVHNIASGKVVKYTKGAYLGTLEEVRSLVERYGEIGQVEFVKGFFCHTLPARPAEERYAMVFEDADLVESVRDVLQHAWPRLQDGCIFFSHEGLDLEVARLFFDDDLWLKIHGCRAPGLVGVGLGLPIDVAKGDLFGMKGICGANLAGVIKG